MSIYAEILVTNIRWVGADKLADFYIQLFDYPSRNPINGNGVTVYYKKLISGIPQSEESTVIFGQSNLIYSGIIGDDQGNVWVDYQVTRIGDVPVTPPNPGACNLTIQDIAVVKESLPGAADGRLTVTASTSYYPLSYSLDNIVFQSSNVFPGLSAGAKTIYVKDANSCTSNRQIYVGVNSGLLVSDPSIRVENNVSRWNAAFNPVVFTFQRKDFDILNISNNGGKIYVSINADLSLLNINDYIYINTSKYEGTYPVVTKSGNVVVLDCPFTANDVGGFTNINSIRRYYKMLVNITYVSNGRLKTLTSTNTPNYSGLTKADLSTFLQTLLSVKDGSNYTAPNYRDLNLSASYQISYAETWEGNTPTFVNISTPFYVLYAAGQLGQKMAVNLAEYVPFKTLTNPNNLAKWVTDFKEPTYTIGKPFDIGFIYSEDLLGLTVTAKIQSLDVNRQPIGLATIYGYLQNEDGSYLLNEDTSRFIIASYPVLSTTGQIVPEQLGLNRLLINSPFPDNVYYLALTLSYGTSPEVKLTQTEIIKINKDVQCSPLYMRWIGLTGSWNYWQFSYNQQHDLDVQNSVIIKRFVEDWANQDTLEDVISKAAAEKITVTAEDISIDDLKGLRSIKVSPKVQMYVDGRFQTVVVNTGTFAEYETLYGVYQFKITFSLPSMNIQTQ